MELAEKKKEEAPEEVSSVDNSTATESPTSDGDVAYPDALRTAFVSLGVALGLSLTIVATAIPQITAELKGIYLIGWYSSAFFIMLACFQPFWGKIYSLFSIKHTFLFVTFTFGVGSLIGGLHPPPPPPTLLYDMSCPADEILTHTFVRPGLAPNSSVLILGRAVMGASAAGLASGGYAILGVTVRPRQRPVFTGFVTTVYSVAKVLGPIVGGYFSQKATWRWCFYVNLPICGVAAVVILLGFRPPPARRRPEAKSGFRQRLAQTDPLSVLLAFSALFCFTRAVEVAGIRQPWGSAEVIGLFVGSGLITAAFLGWQLRRGERAVLVPRLLKQRVVHMGMMYGFFHEGAFYLLIYYVPIYFQVVTGATPTAAGVRNLPLLLSCGVASAISGFLVSRFGHYTPLMVLASAGGCIGAGLLSTLTQYPGTAQWIGFQVLAGFFLGAGLPLGTIAGQAKAKDEDLPSTTAMLLCESIQAFPSPHTDAFADGALGPCRKVAFCVGSSTSLGAAQSVFTNTVLKKLPFLASHGVSNNMIETGIADIRSTYPPAVVADVVAAYTDAVRAVFVIATAYAGAAVVFAAGNDWKRLKLK
ncbi:hypothetical protein PG991_006601 [Apiospora marii]|uniref:Major facilitator superfamily (MFS) profile domain-containing protein n=1 Tax=Apiospora marii TaxID=335849 RepID=A0ABR1S0W0_9PEZI